jgi:glycerophosphoryl diester phosphodiesterase
MRRTPRIVWLCYRRAWRLRGPFLAGHAAMALLAAAIVTPMGAALIRFAVALSGEPALADQDIAFFLLSPVGLLCLIAVSSVLITATVLETALMMSIDLAARQGGRLRLVDGLWHVLARLRELLAFSAQLVVRLLLIAAPFLAVAGLIAWHFLTEYDINYYLAKRPPEFLGAAAAIGLVLGAMAAILLNRLLTWALGLPGILFCGFRAHSAFAESAGLMRGHRRRLLACILLWAGAGSALAAAVLGLVGLFSNAVLPDAGADLGRLAVGMWVVVVLWAAANLLVTALSAGSLSVLLVEVMRMCSAPVSVSFAGTAHASPRRIGPLRRAAIGLGFAALVGLGAGAMALDRLQTSDSVLVIGHRGAAGSRPENTLSAIRKGLEDGADYVEIDVQETADGEVVVVHDSDFMKLAGVDLKVWDASMAELARIDVGSWYGPDYAAERVPTLRSVLEAARGRARVLIELKYYGHDERLEERVARIVEEAGMADSVAVMSLHYPQVQRMKALRPGWRVGLLAARALGDLTRLDADFLAVNSAVATGSFIRHARAAGRDVYVWTVNDPLAMSRMISRGAAGLITDEPAMAREVLAHRVGLSTPQRLMLSAADLFGLDLNRKTYRDNEP